MGRVAAQGRVVVTHDHRTMRPCAENRLKTGLSMIGLILVRQTDALGQVIDDLEGSLLKPLPWKSGTGQLFSCRLSSKQR
jgi:hypothetical protein